MPKETLQLHNLDKGIEEKYGSVENFVEEGQENKIEESMASIEEVETKFKQVQENADKDGRSDEEKEKIRESLIGFNNQKNKISQKERLERDGFNEHDPSYETDYNRKEKDSYKLVRSNDGTEQYWQQKENGDYFLKKMVEEGTVTEFGEAGEIIQQKNEKGEVIEGADTVERTLSNNQELFNESANPENYIRIRKNSEEMKSFEKDAREKFKTMNALAQGSPEREQAYSAWKLAIEKVKEQEKNEPSFINSRDLNNTSLEKETKDAYAKEGVKKLEIQSQNIPSPETNEKGPLARAIEQDENIKITQTPVPLSPEQETILNKGETKIDNENNPLEKKTNSSDKELEMLIKRKGNHASELTQLEREKRSLKKGDKEDIQNNKDKTLIKKEKVIQLDRRIQALEKRKFEISIENKSRIGRMGARMERSFGKMKSWLGEPGNKSKLLKRITIAGGIGVITGLTGGAAGIALAGGAGAAVARSLGAFAGQTLGRNIADKYNKDYRKEMWEERKRFREEEGIIPKFIAGEKAVQDNREKRKEILKAYTQRLEATRNRVIKNENRKKLLAGLAGGILGGLSIRGLQEMIDINSFIPHSEISENVPAETSHPEPIRESVPEPLPEVIPDPIVPENIVSSDAFINKGEGITHALARQINASPELQAAFGLDGPANGQELAEIAKKLGYINEDGSDVRVMMGHGAAYELRIDPNTGEPFVMEYKGGELEGSKYVGGEEVEKHMQGENFEAKARDSYEYIHDGSPQSASSGTERVNFSAKEMYPDIDFDSDVNPRIPNATDIESHGPIGANGEELVRNSQTSTPESGVRQPVTENTPNTPEKRILLQQQAAGVEIRHTTQGTELHPIKGFQFTGEIDNGDFSPRELKFLERGIGAKGYQTLVSFDPTLPPPFAGTHLIQLKNGQYALEKVSFGGSGTDAQAMGERSMKSVMKAFGMPGDVEHFGPTTMPKANIYESHAFVPLSDEQAKFIRESYATLNRALTNVPR